MTDPFESLFIPDSYLPTLGRCIWSDTIFSFFARCDWPLGLDPNLKYYQIKTEMVKPLPFSMSDKEVETEFRFVRICLSEMDFHQLRV